MSITPGPDLVIDCTIVELEPAVRDATGAVIKPPVLQMPTQTLVDLSGDRLTQWQTDQQAATDAALLAEATAQARAWVNLRMIRDRWLAQTDYIEVFLASGFSPLPAAIQDAVTANSAGWLAWRQGLRDLPSTVGTAGTPEVDPVDAVAAAAAIHSTGDTFPAPWPQPPAAPVIHLT